MRKMEDKKVENRINLPLRPTVIFWMLVFFVFHIVLCILSPSEAIAGIWFAIIVLLKEMTAVILTSFGIGFLLTFTDYKNFADKIVNNIDENLNFIKNVEKYPVELIKDVDMIKLQTRIENQKISNLEKAELLKEDDATKYRKYLGFAEKEFSRLSYGYIYFSYEREIVLKPNSEKKYIDVEIKLAFTELIPNIDDEPCYIYSPKFKKERDRNSAEVKAYLNLQDITSQIEYSSGIVNASICEKYKIPLKKRAKNNLDVYCKYKYYFDDNIPMLIEQYYTPNPCFKFSFVCKIIGKESHDWCIDLIDCGFRNESRSVVNFLREEDLDGSSVKISKDENMWISEGAIFLLVKRKK